MSRVASLLVIILQLLHVSDALIRSPIRYMRINKHGIKRHLATANAVDVEIVSDDNNPYAANILRKVDQWACVRNCGACCMLGPIESRPDLDTYLTADELTQYKSMIGADNWCKHFDKEKRLCTIYDERPRFCTVSPGNFKQMFDIDAEEFNVSGWCSLYSCLE